MGWFAKVRKTDPLTSVEAAKSVRNITAVHEHLLQILRSNGPANDEQLLATWLLLHAKGHVPRVSDSGLRSRRSELVARGLVKDSGARVKMASGRNSIVWMVTK